MLYPLIAFSTENQSNAQKYAEKAKNGQTLKILNGLIIAREKKVAEIG